MRPFPTPSHPRRLGLALALVLLSGCSFLGPTRTTRGNLVDLDQLKELVPGTSTRADVTSLIGSPTAHATFDDNTWIYIGQVTRARVGRLPGVDRQQVVELTFDASGTLRGEKVLDKADGFNVSMAAGATPSPGSEASFLQQLIGNVGHFSPGGLGLGGNNGASGPGGGGGVGGGS